MFEIDKGKCGANVPRTVRLPETLCERLCQIAQDNNISFNSLVVQCCNYALGSMAASKTNKPG